MEFHRGSRACGLVRSGYPAPGAETGGRLAALTRGTRKAPYDVILLNPADYFPYLIVRSV
ncbi:hypothetical protein GCM10022403_097540 [Streptomyces coacervatus]|uniref:Uncharacterized protein n=1 Tax=Streptomyces coacervatus TaxID=647381 RepID=A0ABP7JPX6_9ACTN|nr:hypothetical protein [Streptomyces coacervatus]MDF2263995.1 hypothetical protein [Streptomyces coacervatus]